MFVIISIKKKKNNINQSTNQIVQQNDFDYWGVSFKQAYEKILELDHRKVVKITSTMTPAYFNLYME